MFTVEVIQNRTDLFRLEKQWNPLLHRSHTDNIFLTWEWIATWLESYPHNARLFVVAVFDEKNELIGVAPLKIAQRQRFSIRFRQLEFIGSGESASPDFLDFIVDKEQTGKITLLIIETLTRMHQEWDKIRLSDLCQHSVSVSLLENEFERRGYRSRVQADRICPFIPLPANWSACEANLSKNFRKSLRKNRRDLLEKIGAEFQIVTLPGEISTAMEDLARLHQDRMEETNRGGNFRKADYRAFHAAVADRFAQKGWLIIAFLNENGRRIAARYGYLYKDVYYAYQSGFDSEYAEYSPSTVLLSCMIQRFIESGVKEFNFLRGAQRHKYHWTDREHKTVKLDFWNDNSRGFALMAADRLTEAKRQLGRYTRRAAALLGSRADAVSR